MPDHTDAEIAGLRREVERMQSDRQYIVGWNDGFDHVHGPLRFPTILRKMWSGGEVQKWLDEQRIEAARQAASDEGGRLEKAEADLKASEAREAGLREALEDARRRQRRSYARLK